MIEQRPMTPAEIEKAATDLENVSARLMAVLNETPANYVVIGILVTTFVILEGEIRSNDTDTRGEFTYHALMELRDHLREFLKVHLNSTGLDFDAVRLQ